MENNNNTRINVVRAKGFTSMLNIHLQDSRLSLKAIGLMSKMLSLPDNWDYSVAGLAAICKEGEKAIRSALDELETYGYLTRQQSHNKAGRFSNTIYTLYEDPKENPTKTPCAQKGETVNKTPCAQKRRAVNGREKNTNINTINYVNSIKVSTKAKTQKKNTSPKKRESYDDILTAEIESPEVRAALIEYIKARKMQKKSLTNYALKKLIKDLKTMSIDPVEQIKIIDAATVNGWGCFYPSRAAEKQNTKKNDFKKFNQRDYSKEQTAALEVKLLGG